MGFKPEKTKVKIEPTPCSVYVSFEIDWTRTTPIKNKLGALFMPLQSSPKLLENMPVLLLFKGYFFTRIPDL